jgi:ribonuclease R
VKKNKKNKFNNKKRNETVVRPQIPLNKKLLGVIKRHPDGYGFFIAEDKSVADIYVAKHSMEGVMSNDRVEVMARRDGDRIRGEVLRVTERMTKNVSGHLKRMNSSQGVLRDESFAWGEDLKVSWPPQMAVKDKDWVIVNIVSYPDSLRGFQGQVEAVIGDISDPLNDNIRVLSAHSIPNEFPKNALEEAHRLPTEVRESEFRGRKDLRSKKLITIDGKTAKDFDDAIYVEKLPKGFRLWVAIADVSHYVRPGSAIDKEAYSRGTSVYFPNFVAPMLPEALSNELCSLKPHVPRLSLVAEMDMNFEGEVTRTDFYEAVILSHARVTYGEAQEVIDGNTPESLRHVADEIKRASELAHILMDRRFSEGSLNLEIPESTIELNEAGVPVDIIRSERIFAHRLIEELMLAANVAVAKFLRGKNMPAIYRIHEPPKSEALETLEHFLDAFGYHRRLDSAGGVQKRITQALKEFEGRPEETVVNILTLRSMNQAKYSPHNVGHFGLGFDDYTHFTSPIRRYPDLIVHRLVKAALGVSGYQREPLASLEEAGTMLSACEQRSVKAERQVHAIKKARFLAKHMGEEFDGFISSVAKFGVFVTLRQFDVDGLVKVEELGGDYFEFDEDNLRLVGRKNGKAYVIGDAIRVQVAAADHQTGKVDFVLATGEEVKDVPKNQKQPHQKRHAPPGDREHVREVRFSGHRRKGSSQQNRSDRKASPGRHK